MPSSDMYKYNQRNIESIHFPNRNINDESITLCIESEHDRASKMTNRYTLCVIN